MPGKFNYELRRKYPHLIGEDTEAWTKFIISYPTKFDTVDYDVKVGRGSGADTFTDDTDKNYWLQLTKKRIDVIGYKKDIITIIEVKKKVGLHTLGQILGYRFLYLRENPEIKSVKTLIICSSINEDDSDVLNHFGIDFIVV